MEREIWRKASGSRGASRPGPGSANGIAGAFVGADLNALGRLCVSTFGGACGIDLTGPDGVARPTIRAANETADSELLDRVLQELEDSELADQVQQALRAGRTVYRSVPRSVAGNDVENGGDEGPAWLLVPAITHDAGVRVVLVRRGRIFGADDVRDAEAIVRLAALAATGISPLSAAHAQASKDLDMNPELLAAVLHDLRTPLSAIAGYADLLLGGGGGALTDSQRTYLDRIVDGQRTLDRLLGRLFDYQVARLSPTPVEPARIRPYDLLTHIRALNTPELTRKRIDCEIEAGDADAYMVTDATRLNQIMLNLVTNAVKYTPPGGAVTLRWSVTPQEVTIHVTDTGPGIPSDKLDTIFEPFVRLDQTSEGTGLGLAITRELARVLGGRIDVTSSAGEGSTFSVALPRWPSTRPSEMPAETGNPPHGASAIIGEHCDSRA